MKSKAPAVGVGHLPKEAPARKASRHRQLHAVLRKGLGLTSSELRDSLWPGFAETGRTENSFTLPEPRMPYGKCRFG